MEYPKEILPKEGLTYLTGLSNSKLIRHTENKEIWNSEISLVKDEAICSPREGMKDLSCSKYNEFNESFIWIKILKGDFNEVCAPDFPSPTPVFETDFEKVNGRSFLLLNANDIDDKEFELERIIDKNSVKIKVICKVNHTPMKWNYYHISINWYLPLENQYWHQIDKTNTNFNWYKKHLSSFVRTEIRNSIKKEDNPHFANL